MSLNRVVLTHKIKELERLIMGGIQSSSLTKPKDSVCYFDSYLYMNLFDEDSLSRNYDPCLFAVYFDEEPGENVNLLLRAMSVSYDAGRSQALFNVLRKPSVLLSASDFMDIFRNYGRVERDPTVFLENNGKTPPFHCVKYVIQLLSIKFLTQFNEDDKKLMLNELLAMIKDQLVAPYIFDVALLIGSAVDQLVATEGPELIFNGVLLNWIKNSGIQTAFLFRILLLSKHFCTLTYAYLTRILIGDTAYKEVTIEMLDRLLCLRNFDKIKNEEVKEILNIFLMLMPRCEFTSLQDGSPVLVYDMLNRISNFATQYNCSVCVNPFRNIWDSVLGDSSLLHYNLKKINL